MLKRIPPDRLQEYLAAAEAHPMSNPAASYPPWYLHRWHFLPAGYLSRRSVALYDTAIRRLYHALREREALATVTRWLGEIAPSGVLELGCGPGRGLEARADAFPEAALTGVDLSPYMLERAARRVAGRPGVRLMHVDSASLPLPDGSVDAVVTVHHLGHLPPDDAARVMAEAARVLRAGGRLVLADHRWHPLHRPERLVLRRRRRVGSFVHLLEYVRK